MKKLTSFNYLTILLSYFLSSIVIFNPLYMTNNKLIVTIIATVIGFVMIAIILKAYKTTVRVKQSVLSDIFSSFAILLLSSIASFTTLEFTKTISTFSQFYSEYSYKLILGFLIISISLFIVSKNTNAIFRLCSISLFLFLLYYSFMYFGLFSISSTVMPGNTDVTNWTDIVKDSLNCAIYLFSDICVLTFIQNKQKISNKNKMSIYFKTTAIYAAIIITNLIRVCFTFGSKLSTVLENCDIASLKLIPMASISELLIIVSGFAVVIKCGIYLYASKMLFKQIFNKNNNFKRVNYLTLILTLVVLTVSQTLINEKHIFLTTIFYVFSYSLPIILFMCILFIKKE